MQRHPEILRRDQTVLLIVDVQQKINAVMFQGKAVVDSIVKLIKACRTLGVPVFITEQYPKGLGPTEPDILEALAGKAPIQKMTFSCCGSEELVSDLKNQAKSQIILTGIETHVCVQQTALDLLARNFQVHLARDAVSSRKELDHETALERMSRSGAILTTVESVLFELLERAGTSDFKEVVGLIK